MLYIPCSLIRFNTGRTQFEFQRVKDNKGARERKKNEPRKSYKQKHTQTV